ncbi:MAG: hypothetical protein IKU13_09120 [Clostridia bacterium]|nr:hypothetical protein [Clostridia bacterium]
MAINGQDFDTTSYDKVTGKRIKENPTWNNHQFILLALCAVALIVYIAVKLY